MDAPSSAGRRWTSVAALLLFGASVVPALRPEWFVAPTGSIRVMYGPAFAAALALGLVLRVRLAWYVAVATLGALTLGLALVLLPGAAIHALPAGRAVLAPPLALAAAFAILALVRPVRVYLRSADPPR